MAKDVREGKASPHYIIRLMFASMALSGVLILLLSVFVIYHLSQDYIVKRAEAEAVSVSQSLIQSNLNLLLPSHDSKIDMKTIHSLQLDRVFRQFLHPFNIIKIKVYSPDGVIAYASEPSLVGQSNAGNSRVMQANKGKASSVFKRSDEAMDLAFETRLDLDWVATATPIYAANGSVAGVFEVFQDVTRYRADVQVSVGVGTVIVLLILLVVFFIAFKVTQIPVRQLMIAQEKMKVLASFDALTTVSNRYQIIKTLKIELARAVRESSDLGLILLDLDHFKAVNDTYGHLAGDEVLRTVAKTIRDNIREYDTVGRYGGEEFLIVLPGSNRIVAFETAERVRKAVETLVIHYEGQLIPVAISAGLTAFETEPFNTEQLIKKADDALYLAKERGRNCVITDLVLEATAQSPVALMY